MTEKSYDQSKSLDQLERLVAQGAYGPLKIAGEIIGLLNTVIPRGQDEASRDRRRRSVRKDVAEIMNPFDSENFRDQITRLAKNFSDETGSNLNAQIRIFDLIDADIAQRRELSHVRAKIIDLSLFYMDQTRWYLKRQYPW